MPEVLADNTAFAGHAGETVSPLMPHEIMSGVALLLVLVLFIGALTAVMLRRLNRLERRLRRLEASQNPEHTVPPPD